MTAFVLARLQFAISIAFHFLFSSISIGLIFFLAIIEAMYLYTNNKEYQELFLFWSKIFGMTFGLGVVTGIVIGIELAANWNPFSTAVGAVLGPLFVLEVLSAFFIEAGFIGIVLFGWGKVSKGVHFLATCLTCLGTHISLYAIVTANSWMHTPAGFFERNGKFEVLNWHDVFFNPSALVRVSHTFFATYITAFCIILGISSFLAIKKKKRHEKIVHLSYRLLLCFFFTQLTVGDMSGLKIFQYKPEQTAAIEGIWETGPGAPFLLTNLPSDTEGKNRWAIPLPKLASFFNTHHFDGVMMGLKELLRSDRPHMFDLFWWFRIMFYIGYGGFAFLFLVWWFKRKKELPNWILYLFILMTPFGALATESGFISSCRGRQPWIVYGLMKASEGVSHNLTAHQIKASLGSLSVLYTVLLFFYIFYFKRLVREEKNKPDSTKQK